MIKKFFIVALVILIAAAGALYYYFDKITSLPEWYQQLENQTNTEQEVFRKDFDKTDLTERSSEVMKKIRPAGTLSKKSKSEKPVTLNAGEFHDLMLGRMMESSENDSLIRSLNATHVKIHQNSIEAGAVVDLSGISQNGSSGKEMKWIKTATSVFPFLKDEEVHFAIDGKPVIEKGKLTFDSGATVSIGEINMTLSELAGKLGTTVEKLKKNLAIPIDQTGMKDIRIEKQLIVID